MSGFSIPLSGLAATSSSLNVIANNLANLNTDGYKDQSLSFGSVFNEVQGTSGNGDPIQIGGGVQTDSTISNFANGGVNSTGIASNMALQGDGFFVVKNANGTEYTRNGNFTVNAQGQIADAQGQLVMGYPSVNGQIQTSSVLSPITVTDSSVFPANQSTQFQMTTNLNANSTVGTVYSAPMTVYDSLGNSHNLTINYTNTAANAWTYQITIPAADLGGTGAPVQVATGNMTFGTNGALTAPTGTVPGVAIAGLADGAANMNLTWNLNGSGGSPTITQEAATSATTASTQDGYSAGSLTGYSILSDGTVQGQFSNNQTLVLGQVAVASFANNQGLTKVTGGNYQASFASGTPILGQAGVGGNGTITGGAVEGSNVNLSTEFANMIVAQQAYEANAKVLTTLNQVSQATLQVIQ
ncbi:MAG TPA: flagellar hook protein FlgE [Terracidiphilus sp.]|jgi:flagellar hook protein FlgE|nr:flagellar hook protein FlgE [Terracidiphilus sp.]